ncbi:MAG TPA: S41 family peptidase [Thermoanaerobaculia bacterium]|nr:S41 family peptidase [Thermoanaerobaculia bacterium]
MTERPGRPSTRAMALFPFLLWCLSAFLAAQPGEPPRHAAPVNLGFEQGDPGQTPPGWKVPEAAKAAGYTAAIDAGQAASGARSALLSGPAVDPRSFGNLMQSVDAAPYRGQRVRYRAAVRIQSETGGWANLWLRIDRPGGALGFLDNMQERPITSAEWASYEIVADVAPDAESLNLGMMYRGGGRGWIDSVSLEVIGESGEGNEPPRALTGRGLENLIAFTRLLGYVRFFHPSDQAGAADWNRVALAGVQAAEPAAGAAALARTLEDLFRPLAPTVRVFPTGQTPPLPAELSRPAAGAARVVAWEHAGVDLSEDPMQRRYESHRADGRPRPGEFGTISQHFDAAALRGKKVRFRAAVRAEVQGENQAQLWLRVDRPNGEMGFFDNMRDRPIRQGEWNVYEITGDVAPDAQGIVAGVMLDQEGRVWIDEASLEAVGEEGRNLLQNGGFETDAPGAPPAGWSLPGRGDRSRYSFRVTEESPWRGRRSAVIAYTREEPSGDPGKPFVADLGGGVSAMVPLALYADDRRTLPHSAADVTVKLAGKPEGFLPSGNDRTTRLAAVALAWNVFQHFYPYFEEVQTDWPAVLRQSLHAAATDADEIAFGDTLRRLVAALQDGHGNVNGPSRPRSHVPPLTWAWIEDRLVVTYVPGADSSGIRPGDVVVAIDGKPVRQVLEAAEALISSPTPQWRRYIGLREIARGSEGEEVRLDIQPREGQPFTATLRRSATLRGPGSIEEPRPEKIAEIRPGIFYLDVERANDGDFRAARDRLATAKGVIFDVRGYPSVTTHATLAHLTGEEMTSAQWHVPLVTRPDREGMGFAVSNWAVKPAQPRFQGKVAFLTDGRAISYAETYMGIVEHYKLGEIVGGPTAGTNGNINPFRLPGGYTINWTGMKVLKHDGSRHHGVGIQPTVPVSRTIRGVAEGRDEVLEKAIEIVSRP